MLKTLLSLPKQNKRPVIITFLSTFIFLDYLLGILGEIFSRIPSLAALTDMQLRSTYYGIPMLYVTLVIGSYNILTVYMLFKMKKISIYLLIPIVIFTFVDNILLSVFREKYEFDILVPITFLTFISALIYRKSLK